MTITIDPTLRSLIPPLRAEERAELERSIVEEGVREPIVIWKGRGLILDGHNRFEIAQRVNMPFDIVEREFHDIESAKLWMLSNQLGRRNLTPDQYKQLVGRLYNETRRAQGENQHTMRVGQSDPPNKRTSQAIAERTGLSERTIRRAAKVVEEVEQAASEEGASEDIRALPEALTSGKTTLRQAKEQVALARSGAPKPEKCAARRTVGVIRVVKTPEGFVQAIRKHFDDDDVRFIVSQLQ